MEENALFNRTAPPAEGGGTQVIRAIDDIHIFNMKIITSYFFLLEERQRAEDFCVISKDNQLHFLILQQSPENKVDMYGIKQN